MRDAKNRMDENRIRHLPVVNSSNEIIGMLSERDVTDMPRFQDFPVNLFATSPVQYVTAATPLSTVALLMLEKKISAVLLCDSQKMAIGMITSDDILLQFSKMMKDVEAKSSREMDPLDIVVGAGEFFKKLSEIGI